MRLSKHPVAVVVFFTALVFASAPGCTAGAVGGPDPDGGSTGTGGGGGGGNDPEDAGTSGEDGGTASPDASSKTIYCGQDSDSECVCATEQSSASLTASNACDLAGIGTPGLCCAVAGWPTVSGGAFGGCYCSKIFCETDGDVCQCGFGKPTAGDTAVSSCTPQSGEICCRSKSDIAPTCACYKATKCESDSDEQVSSCGPENLACAGNSVSSCR